MPGLAEGWMDDARCRGMSVRLFFPEDSRVEDELSVVVNAKRICRRCEVRGECLGYALRLGVAFGVWGGTTVSERRKIRREMVA